MVAQKVGWDTLKIWVFTLIFIKGSCNKWIDAVAWSFIFLSHAFVRTEMLYGMIYTQAILWYSSYALIFIIKKKLTMNYCIKITY